jgi:hypothetical protein
MNDMIRRERNDVFLDQHFDSVGHGLKQAEWANPIRAVTILHSAENLSLENRHQGEECEEYTKQHEDVEQTRHNLDEPIGRMTHQWRKQPCFCTKENLINNCAAHVAGRKAGVIYLIKADYFCFSGDTV